MGDQDQGSKKELQHVVDALLADVKEYFASHSRSQIAACSKDEILGFFIEDQDNVKNLFVRAQALRGRVTLPKQSIAFWRRVTGMRGGHSSANILAIILAQGIDFMLAVWDDYLKVIGLAEDQTSSSGTTATFCDDALPLSTSEWSTYFTKTKHAEVLEYGQHEYCQVPPEELDVQFEDQRGALYDIIVQRAFRTCSNFDRAGEPVKSQPHDTWVSESALYTIRGENEELIKRLYIGWRNSQCTNKPHEDHSSRRRYFEECKEQSSKFFQALHTRTKILAILVDIKAGSSSTAWKCFVDDCCNGQRDDGLTDEMLPVPFSDLKDRFDFRDQHRFHSAQFTFCPVKLDRDLPWQHNQWCLPLEKTTLIGTGSFGQVYNVETAEEYRLTKGQKKLRNFAMKVVKSNESYSEWRLSETISTQEMMSSGIMVPLATLTKGDETFLFMELATCNLYEYMMNYPEPRNTEQRLEKFQAMLSVARALKYLHCDLRQENKVKQVCIHGDIKTRNILYNKGTFQIADFGISMFEHVPRAVPSGEQIPDSARNVQSQSRLSKFAENCPPELENGESGDASLDIWGFGTVFAQYIAWIKGGKTALEGFNRARADARFFHTAGNEASLKDGVRQWFEDLINETDGTSQPMEKKMYSECWDLIREGLLNCKAGKRMKIEDVCKTLDDMFERLRRICDGDELPGNKKAPESRQTVAVSMDGQAVPHDSARNSSVGSRSSEYPRSQSSHGMGHSILTATGSNGSERGASPTSTQCMPESRGRDSEHRSIQATESSLRLQSALKGSRENEAIKLLDASIDARFVDDHGNTALHYAVRCKNPQIVKKLLSYEPQLLTQENSDRQTALHRCVKFNTLHNAEVLIGEDWRRRSNGSSLMTMKDKHDQTPLEYAEHLQRTNTSNKPMVKLLRDHSRKIAQHTDRASPDGQMANGRP